MHLLAECFLAQPTFVPAYFVQDYEPDFYPESDRLTRQAVLDTYRMTPFCFAKTPWICDKVRAAGGTIELVPPGVDLDLFRPRPASRGVGQKPVVLMMVRPATPHRGLDTLRNTLTALAAAGAADKAEFQAFGCPPEELAGLGLPLPVTALGVLPNVALPQIYSDACLFLETSHFHGFGRTAAEAMACGTPCVLTDSGGVRLFAEPGKNCLMAEPGDAAALAAQVLRLLSTPEERARLAEHCRASVMDFDLRRSSEKTLEFLRHAAGVRRA
jgi:glycosyltransferase involved in cell wall biosynthesis